MNVTPDTTIRLLKCPLELDNKNQITFATLQAQTTYFLSLTYLEIDGSMYQRRDSSIYYPGLFDDLIGYNYVMYQNTHYSNKWFYAFITGMEYLNDNTTKITIVTDPYQTWQFDITFKQCFVEREMIAPTSDVPGANLVPEDLETGEYKVQTSHSISNLEPVYVFCYGDAIWRSVDSQGDPHDYDLEISVGASNSMNGMPVTDIYYLCSDTLLGCFYLQHSFMLNNQSEKLVAAFTVPKFCISGITNTIKQAGGTALDVSNVYVLSGNSAAATSTFSSTPATLDGYTPKNAKVRQYPYLYLGYNPPNGTSKIFRYENFTSGTPSFHLISEINPNPSVYFIPQNYRGPSGNSLSDNVTLNGYPQLASKVDTYNSWLAENTGIINVQNSQAVSNLKYDTISALSQIGGGIGSLASENIGGLGEMASGALTLNKTFVNYDYYTRMVQAQKEKQQMLPDNVTLGGSNATLLGYGLMDDNIFTTYCVKYQFAKRIDDYFSMYGYQTNELKVPNLNNRPKWNYVKTLGANILGNIPQDDMETIKKIFDNGVTLWHDTSHFLDYSQTNK